MILHLAPETPALIRAAATAALVTHIGGATIALISGPLALAARKGSMTHRIAGTAFFIGMLGMSIVGGVLAPLFPDRISSMAGFIAFYLIVTGWAAVKRGAGRVGRFEVGAFFFALGVVAAGLILGPMGVNGKLDGGPAVVAYVFAGLAAIAAAGDLNMILRGGLTGSSRVARHLWRMGVALFIAAGSFAAQPRAQPDFVRGSPFLIIPALLILAYTLYWLIKARFGRSFRAARLQRAPA